MTILDSDTPQGTAEESRVPTAAELFAEDDDSPEENTSQTQTPKAEEAKTAPEEGEEPEEGDDATDEAQAEDSESEESAKVKLTDGTEITLGELEKGYLRQADYTRKTQELSEGRKELEAAAQRVIGADQEARHAIGLAMQVINAIVPPEPDTALLDNDPVSYLRAQAARKQALGVVAQLQAAQKQAEERDAQTKAGLSKKALADEARVMVEKIPALATEQGRAKFRNEAVEIGARAYGLTPNEIDAIQSHKELMVLADAIAYRKLQSQKMSAVAKAKSAPKLLAPAARSKEPANLIDSLKKAGRTPTAADYFASLED